MIFSYGFIQFFIPYNVLGINSINIDMKPLLISFFVVILCYSLFFERRETPVHIDEINYTNKAESFDTLKVSDPARLYTENIHHSYLDLPE